MFLILIKREIEIAKRRSCDSGRESDGSEESMVHTPVSWYGVRDGGCGIWSAGRSLIWYWNEWLAIKANTIP